MIHKILLYMRKAGGFSQKELAEKVKIASSTLSGYEIQNSSPNYSTVEQIADACDFDIVFVDRNSGEQITAKNIGLKLKK